MSWEAHAIDYNRLAAAREARSSRVASLLNVSYLHAGALTSVAVYPSGVIVRQDEPRQPLGPGGVRSNITGFSDASARRLKKKLVKLDFRQNHWQFVTLTYPGEYSYDPLMWKKNLKAFRAALERSWGDVFRGAIWRLEQQKRGAPHFHLLVCWHEKVPIRLLRTFVRQTWTRIVGGAGPNAKWVRTQVQDCRIQAVGGLPKLMSYLCKYLGKKSHSGWLDPLTGELLAVGRSWGEWGELPYAVAEVYLLGPSETAAFVRRLRKARRNSRFLSKMTVDRFQAVFWGEPEFWRNLLRGLSWDTSPGHNTGQDLV
jgi:hypothetical protein